jgi:hypothetical protein
MEHGVLPGMTPAGALPGHNFYTCYHEICVAGMGMLLRALPPRHRLYHALKACTILAANQLISRLQPDGRYLSLNRTAGDAAGAAGRSLFEVARAIDLPLDDAIALTMKPYLEGSGVMDAADFGHPAALCGRYLAERKEQA